MQIDKKCCHCGTTENLGWGVWWIESRELCQKCHNKYIILRSDHHSAIGAFFRKGQTKESTYET